ncbi:hypothetical protein ACQSSU_24690 [Micromonospora echinospora]
MEEPPAFGVQLVRLAEVRGIGVGALARRASVAETEITSVSRGNEPEPSARQR